MFLASSNNFPLKQQRSEHTDVQRGTYKTRKKNSTKSQRKNKKERRRTLLYQLITRETIVTGYTSPTSKRLEDRSIRCLEMA